MTRLRMERTVNLRPNSMVLFRRVVFLGQYGVVLALFLYQIIIDGPLS
jgi:hypothetical protein